VKLHKHQERGVRHLTLNDRAGLFMGVGSGKTLTTLAALSPVHLPALVVAPKQVCEHVWPAEVAKWRPELSVALAAGTPAKRRVAIEQRADITVISYDNLADLISGNGRRALYPFATVVLDESHSVKNKSTARWRLVHRLTAKAAHVWMLTGTPSGNGLADLWAQLALLDDGERLGKSLTAFRQRYFTAGFQLPNGAIVGRELKPGSDTSIYRAIEDICLHVPLEDLDLPDLVINPVPIILPSRKIYDELKNNMISGLDLIGGDMLTVPSAGVLSSKLLQVTAGGVYGEDGELHELHTAKLDALSDIIEQTEGNVLVFYKFTFEADRILKRFKQATHIKTPGAIDAWNRREIPILLAHPASAGAGLNLQHGGSTIVWATLSWSSTDWLQANGRLHRQGQSAHRVMVHVLTAADTIDEHALDVVQGKVSVQQALLDALV
jgi:SNF2 family DNA or RNA helicase